MRKFVDWMAFGAFMLLIWAMAPATLGGVTSYVIVDGRSMEPEYANGDLVVARARDHYAVGDIITYDAPTEVPYRVIHRIARLNDDGYITQGDNRDEVDGWTVPFEAVHGSSWLHIPYGGTAAMLLRQPAVLIGIFAGWMTLTFLTRREQRDDDGPEGATDQSDGSPADPPARGKQLANVALFGGMIALGLGGGFMVASAASLQVDAGVLQAFVERDIDIPVSDEHDEDARTDEPVEVDELVENEDASGTSGTEPLRDATALPDHPGDTATDGADHDDHAGLEDADPAEQDTPAETSASSGQNDDDDPDDQPDGDRDRPEDA
jgi:signal peptidase I